MPRASPAYRLTLQTREQHIRREKATSNICTAQVLLAVMASMYAVYHGPEGLTRIASRVARLTAILAAGLRELGHQVVHATAFDTLCIEAGETSTAIVERAQSLRANLRVRGNGSICVSLDETTTRDDVELLWRIFSSDECHAAIDRCAGCECAVVDPGRAGRSSDFLTHPVFNTHHSEHELLRYMRALADKDLAMDRTMIPLGSCTMKLNATAEMIPVTWPEFGNIHPLAPAAQAQGYKELIEGLEAMLVECTGYDAVSLQPNSGAQGEYAGLLAIRAYHASRGEAQRDICLIPESAHGTNPASAQMCGMNVVVTKCDANGNVDVEDIRRNAEKYGDRLAALMITYPSTHGVFEEDVVEICEIVHAHGGQVYTDGANMNALVGVAKPGKWGSDVSHLNLHKTFCIPHGGGGPGVGPCAVKSHLAPFLPKSADADAFTTEGVGAGTGQRRDLRIGIDPADQLDVHHHDGRQRPAQGHPGGPAQRQLHRQAAGAALPDALHRPQRPGGARVHPRPAPARNATGISAEDVAKRLIDFGFHAPTLSFPVAGTLMVEPTESESLHELDRFIDAMIQIRDEIRVVEHGELDREDNPLKHAPHTATQVAPPNGRTPTAANWRPSRWPRCASRSTGRRWRAWTTSTATRTCSAAASRSTISRTNPRPSANRWWFEPPAGLPQDSRLPHIRLD